MDVDLVGSIVRLEQQFWGCPTPIRVGELESSADQSLELSGLLGETVLV